jgi:hypothetical protein
MTDDIKPIKIFQTNSEEVNLCLNYISDQPFGIQLAQEPAYQVIIGKDIHLVLLNKQYSDIENAKQLLQHKSMLGIIAYKKRGTWILFC